MRVSRGATLEGQDQADSLLIWEFQRMFSGFGRGVASSSECLRLLGHWWREVQADGHCCRDEKCIVTCDQIWLLSDFHSCNILLQRPTKMVFYMQQAANYFALAFSAQGACAMHHPNLQGLSKEKWDSTIEPWLQWYYVIFGLGMGAVVCWNWPVKHSSNSHQLVNLYIFYKIFQFVQGMISWWSSMRHDSCSSE